MKFQPGLTVFTAIAFCGLLSAQEYEGPTVLSRSGGGVRPYGQRIGEDAKLRVFGEARAIYDYGFLPVSISSTGTANKYGGQFGYEGRLGIYGTKRWRRTSLGLDYTGSYRGYVQNTFFNGADNFLGLEFGHQADRRTQITGTVTAGTSSRVFSFASNLLGSPLGNILPTTDVFDARTYFLNGGMGVSRQLNARLGIELRADAFQVERHSTALVSVRGYSPKAALSYRLNRRYTIGGIYNFLHFDYPRAFGESNIQVAMGYVNYDINRLFKVELQGGAFVADTAGTRTVAADPAVRALLGITQISEAFSRVVTLPNAQFRLTGRTGNSSFALALYRGVGAGNGVTLSSSEQSGSVLYKYVISKNMSFSARGTYSSAAGLSNTADRFSTILGGGDIEYHTLGSILYRLEGNYRHSNVKSVNTFIRDSFQIGVGVGWSPRGLSIPGL